MFPTDAHLRLILINTPSMYNWHQMFSSLVVQNLVIGKGNFANLMILLGLTVQRLFLPFSSTLKFSKVQALLLKNNPRGTSYQKALKFSNQCHYLNFYLPCMFHIKHRLISFKEFHSKTFNIPVLFRSDHWVTNLKIQNFQKFFKL